jgi:transcriptional regulator with XRE-family HTH domain
MVVNMNETLGSYIKRAREAAGYTQEELASRAQVSQQSIAKWEANDAMPRIGNVLALANALGVKPSDLTAARNLQRRGDMQKLSDLIKVEGQEREIEARHAPVEPKGSYTVSKIAATRMRQEADVRASTDSHAIPLRKKYAEDFENDLFGHISPAMMKGERNTRIEGGTVTWRPDYVSSKLIADIYCMNSPRQLAHMFIKGSLVQRLWRLATIKAFLNDRRECLLIVYRPRIEALDEIPQDTMVDRSIRQTTVEAAFLGVKLVVVQTAEEGAREILAAEYAEYDQDIDFIDDE